MRPQWVPYPVERGPGATAQPFAAVGEKGQPDYLAAGRWWDRPAYAMGSSLRGFTGNERFQTGSEAVIKRTSGATSRKNRAAVVAEQGRL